MFHGVVVESSVESFLFSLKDHAGVGPVKMPIQSDKTGDAVCHDSSHGPLFGRGHDLYVASNANANSKYYCNVSSTYHLPSNTNDPQFLTRLDLFTVLQMEERSSSPKFRNSLISSRELCRSSSCACHMERDSRMQKPLELPYAYFNSQDMLIREIVKKGSTGIKRGVVLLRGVQINTGPDTPDYFVPLRFKYNWCNPPTLEPKGSHFVTTSHTNISLVVNMKKPATSSRKSRTR